MKDTEYKGIDLQSILSSDSETWVKTPHPEAQRKRRSQRSRSIQIFYSITLGDGQAHWCFVASSKSRMALRWLSTYHQTVSTNTKAVLMVVIMTMLWESSGFVKGDGKDGQSQTGEETTAKDAHDAGIPSLPLLVAPHFIPVMWENNKDLGRLAKYRLAPLLHAMHAPLLSKKLLWTYITIILGF